MAIRQNERAAAVSKFTYLKRQLYELGQKAQALVNDINQETDTFISDKDFSQMDFEKVESLAKELQAMQEDYKGKVEKMNSLKETYNL